MMKVESISDNVRKYLADCIFKGDFCPGQQIKEQEVASQLGISRPPVREALKLLEGDGLIVRKPNHGAFVTKITEKDAWEIYSLKSELYAMATQLAFPHITHENIRQWEIIVGEMEECVVCNPPDILKYQELNQEFHDLMIDISDHGRLKKIAEMLHNQVKHFSSRSLVRKGHLDESLLYHKKIVAGIKQGDVQLTAKLTKDHVSMALEFVQKLRVDDAKSGLIYKKKKSVAMV